MYVCTCETSACVSEQPTGMYRGFRTSLLLRWHIFHSKTQLRWYIFKLNEYTNVRVICVCTCETSACSVSERANGMYRAFRTSLLLR